MQKLSRAKNMVTTKQFNMNNIDKQYQDLLRDILYHNNPKVDRTGTGTISVFGRQIRHSMSEGFPLLTTKKMAWKSIVTELLWFLRGDTNIKYLVDNGCNIWNGDAWKNYSSKTNEYKGDWPDTQEEFINKIKIDGEFAKQWGELGPIYGAQWRKWDGIDQIQELINSLKTNPDSRRMLVSAWNVNYLDEMVLPPCHYGFQVYTRELTARERTALGSNGSTRLYDSIKEENYITVDADDVMHTVCDDRGVPRRAISLMWNQRSVDTFLGLPFNIASYGLLLEIIAKAVNMVPDELIGNLGDVHLYLNHIEQAKLQAYRSPFELPKLNINTEFWPTEGGECGIGPINATAVFNGFHNENFCKCLLEEDIQLYDYQSHPAIKAPLSN